MTQDERREKLVEDVAALLCNLDEDQPPDAQYGQRIMSHRDSPHRGDCTKEPFTCVRCLYIIEAKRAATVLDFIAARLSEVTPEMVEAWRPITGAEFNSTQGWCAAEWRAMLSASALGKGGK